MSRRRLLAVACYAVAGLLGVAVALATAGCGSGGGGGLSTALTLTRPTIPGTTTAPPEGETQTTVTFETTTEAAPVAPSVTVTETFPSVTETLPANTVTVTKTLPVSTETLPATTETLPATTVTTTAVNPAAAAAAGAAVASAQTEEPSETPWGWIAFAILAVAGVAGGLVWWWMKRAERKRHEAGFASRAVLAAEPLDEEAVPEAAVADRELVALQLVEHRPDDAGAGEDHLGPCRLQADDLATLLGGSTPVELDLALDLSSVEHRAVDDLGVVRGEAVPDGGEVREGAAEADERGRPLAARRVARGRPRSPRVPPRARRPRRRRRARSARCSARPRRRR